MNPVGEYGTLLIRRNKNMIIGVPKEIKEEEFRVSLTPAGASGLRQTGHTILIEKDAGLGSGFQDREYLDVGADIADRETVFGRADLIVKVKEPVSQEFDLLQEEQALFTYLHLAPNRELTNALITKKTVALAYETLEQNGALPLLMPMSEVAGRMAPLMGCYYLQRFRGGRGLLPTGLPGVRPARALILGAGVVGTNAARVCHGLGMETAILNRGSDRLRKIDEMFDGEVTTLPLSPETIAQEIRSADMVIGAVLVPGGRTPVLISRAMLKTMRPGAILIDVSIDQGGCAETSRPTTHDDPVYEIDGIIHYSVANMPGAYPRTSTLALTNATIPYITLLANLGIESAIRKDPEIGSSVNLYRGKIVHKGLARALNKEAVPLDSMG